MRSQRKKPAKRLFNGMAGSPLAQIAVAEQAIPSPPVSKAVEPSVKNMVLLHFCFDQQGGETKNEWCPCKKRISRDAAFALVRSGCADWLLTKNGKAKSGVSEFHRAIVVRFVVLDGEKLYAVKPPLTIDRREKKHEAIKQTIRDKARRLLQKLFAKGAISQAVLEMPNAELDELLGDGHKTDKFLTKLTELGQNDLRKKMARIIEHWWNNILGYHRLNVEAYRYLEDADRGKGLAVSGGNDSGHLDQIDGQHAIDAGRVVAANHRASYWNGAWDYSTGAAPKDEEGNATVWHDEEGVYEHPENHED